ncbi:MAG TPA: hypothetical protein VG055_22685 [Planctomycetaceae bacterium]|jgi:hypothetical protein|nr:hypothetical protein [Planctomycetaceae bacterium]
MNPDLTQQIPGWFLLVLGVVAFLYLGGPLLTYVNLRQSADPNVVRLEATQQALLPAGIRNYLERVENELRVCGFERVDDVALPNQVRNVAANLRLFLHRENQDFASCTAAYSKIGNTWGERLKYVAFTTYFRNGTTFGTSNLSIPGCFPPRPNYRSTKFRTVQSAGELYELHRAVISDEARTGTKELPLLDRFGGDAAAYIRWTMLAEMQDATNSGCLYLNEKEGKYVPTVIGAIVMTWKQLWPWKLFLVRANDKKAAEIVAR